MSSILTTHTHTHTHTHTKGHKETFTGGEYVCFLDYGDDITGVCICLNSSIALNMCSFLFCISIIPQ